MASPSSDQHRAADRVGKSVPSTLFRFSFELVWLVRTQVLAKIGSITTSLVECADAGSVLGSISNFRAPRDLRP